MYKFELMKSEQIRVVNTQKGPYKSGFSLYELTNDLLNGMIAYPSLLANYFVVMSK